jgi:hypothetical protein
MIFEKIFQLAYRSKTKFRFEIGGGSLIIYFE